MTADRYKRRLGDRYRLIPKSLSYPRPEAVLSRPEIQRIVKQLKAAGEVRPDETIQYYDPWYYWLYEYEANPSSYYRGHNNKFDTGIVCSICDNYNWPSPLEPGTKQCKECLAAGLDRHHYQTTMFNQRKKERSQMPKRIKIISTEDVATLGLALEAVASKSL